MRIIITFVSLLLIVAISCQKKQVPVAPAPPPLPITAGMDRAEQNKLYKPLVEAGEKALKEMKYDSCMIHYKEAFKLRQTSHLSTLRNAACAHSFGDNIYRDEQLDIAFNLDWGGTKYLFENYPEFEYLQESPFAEIIKTRYRNAATASGVDLALMDELATIGYEDQRYRQEMRSTEEKYGNDSPQMDSLWVLQNRADSLNTSRITQLIDEKGYPGRSMVGNQQASTAFLVIQHASLEVQEKYLKIITDAADAEEVQWSSVALLVDRINMRNGRPQKYGSQLNSHPITGAIYFPEIENPHKIDSVRATVGLGPIQDYASYFDYTWDAEKHIQLVKQVKEQKAKEGDGK